VLNAELITLAELINAARVEDGQMPLRFNDALLQAANQHAQWMHSNSKLSHHQNQKSTRTVVDRTRQFGYAFPTIGENIAQGQKTPAAVMTAWLASSGHRANILGNFTEFGVACATTFWCVVFGRSE